MLLKVACKNADELILELELWCSGMYQSVRRDKDDEITVDVYGDSDSDAVQILKSFFHRRHLEPELLESSPAYMVFVPRDDVPIDTVRRVLVDEHNSGRPINHVDLPPETLEQIGGEGFVGGQDYLALRLEGLADSCGARQRFSGNADGVELHFLCP